jgi:hypothetical protein
MFSYGMSTANSKHARWLALGITLAGMGKLFTKGLFKSRRLFNVRPETSSDRINRHDKLYALAYNAVITPLFYLGAGVRDAKQIVLGTLASMAIAYVIGGRICYAVDVYRDLSGIEGSPRLPQCVRELTPALKRAIAIGAIAASIASTSGIYSLAEQITPETANPRPQIRQVETNRTSSLEYKVN